MIWAVNTTIRGFRNMNLFEEKKNLDVKTCWMYRKLQFVIKSGLPLLTKLKSTRAGNHDINLVYDFNKSQVDINLKPNETKEYTNLTS